MAYQDSVKGAVLADLLAGKGTHAEIAKRHKVTIHSVRSWQKTLVKPLRHALALMETTNPHEDQKFIAPQTAAEIIRTSLLSYLDSSIKALKMQVDISADKEWIKSHSPADLAVLHREIGHSAFRLLEAFGQQVPADDGHGGHDPVSGVDTGQSEDTD